MWLRLHDAAVGTVPIASLNVNAEMCEAIVMLADVRVHEYEKTGWILSSDATCISNSGQKVCRMICAQRLPYEIGGLL